MTQRNTQRLEIAMGLVASTVRRTLKAVSYLRVSTEDQAKGYGIEYSDKRTTAYINRKRWEHVGTYRDEGVSGALKAADRGDLKRLMEDARRTPRPFDLVVVNEGRVIGRVGRAFWLWVWELEDLGVYVAVVQNDYDNTTDDGREKMRADADYAMKEWTTIRRRTQGGLQEKAEDGGWPGGQPPYGYKICCKGQKGKSHLVKDDREVEILHLARKMLVEEGLNNVDAAARLNARGREFYTRSGVPWSHSNLRAKLLSESTLNARVIFRNPNRAKAGHGAKFNEDGTPVNGQTVIIKLDPVFTPDEVADLNRAMGRLANGTPKSKPHGYPLSKRLFNTCGAHSVGMKRSGRPGRWYRCSGKAAKFPGDPQCACDMVDADAVEGAVWRDVVELLGDPERLKAMAAEWVGMAEGQQANHADRIADLDRQIKEREQALTVMVVDYAKAGIPAVAVQAATRALTEDLEQFRGMRAEAAAWLEETEATEQRARDLEALATVARTRLADMTPAEQAEVLALLDVRVIITGPVPKAKLGLACSMTEWFKVNGRLVPPTLTDEAWALVEPIVKAWEPEHPNRRLVPGRLMLDAMFHKARTGVRWADLPERFGGWNGIHTRYKTWANGGVWDQIMAALPDTGTVVPALDLVPPLRVEGRVDPRVLAGAEPVPAGMGVPGPATSGLSAGVHELLRGEAVLVTDAAEVVELVGGIGELAPERRGPVLARDLLDPATARVLEALPAGRPARVAEVALAAATGTDEVIGRLYELHSLGFVERQGDGWQLAGQTPGRGTQTDTPRRGGR
ncbi:recombinase family protein [Streptomyces goshikiensis]|uniref:recombinase family protein n=1 Tax=Streptomyces goshikiensis TaxID=1942 RepID=UPI0037A40B10